ncbi:putative porin [Acinetobacter populi]|uniref:Putative porin n=1 Tax=Acinetobacter populi TaxID=1582270 RepID=A0A1Z9Z008_9GAMM|nr:putative porin [Acinetobacter populi]OUY07811.1 putative porin [Acinetobacter populi]
MKKLSLATAIFASVVAMGANAYQAEVGGTINYIDPDHADSATGFAIDGTYYFNPVQVKNAPLNEAAFLNRASNVNGAVSYADNDGYKVTTYGIGAEYFVPNTDFYVAGNIARTTEKEDGFKDWDTTTYKAEVGYLPVANLLIAVGVVGYDDDYSDDVDPTLRAKYVTQLSGYDVNFEAATSFGDTDYYNLGADLYLDKTLSVGVAYSGSNDDLIDEDVFTLRAKKFFTQEFSVEANAGFGDDYNIYGIRAAYRF